MTLISIEDLQTQTTAMRIDFPPPDPNVISCPNCHGHGYLLGTGSMAIGMKADGGSFMEYTPSTMCPQCGGTGKLKRCPNCNGAGGCR